MNTAPGGEFRRDVHHLLAVGQQLVGDVPADALAPFDCRDSVRPLLRLLPSIASDPSRSVPKRPPPTIVSSRRLARSWPTLVRVDPDDQPSTPSALTLLRCSDPLGCRAGRALLPRAEQTPDLFTGRRHRVCSPKRAQGVGPDWLAVPLATLGLAI